MTTTSSPADKKVLALNQLRFM